MDAVFILFKTRIMLAPFEGKFGLTAASTLLKEVSKRFKTIEVKSKSVFDRQPEWETCTKVNDMGGMDYHCWKYMRSSIVSLSGGKNSLSVSTEFLCT